MTDREFEKMLREKDKEKEEKRKKKKKEKKSSTRDVRKLAKKGSWQIEARENGDSKDGSKDDSKDGAEDDDVGLYFTQ